MAKKAGLDRSKALASIIGKEEKASEAVFIPVPPAERKEKKVRVNLSLNPSDYEKIRLIAEKKRISVSSLISIMIADRIESENK